MAKEIVVLNSIAKRQDTLSSLSTRKETQLIRIQHRIATGSYSSIDQLIALGEIATRIPQRKAEIKAGLTSARQEESSQIEEIRAKIAKLSAMTGIPGIEQARDSFQAELDTYLGSRLAATTEETLIPEALTPEVEITPAPTAEAQIPTEVPDSADEVAPETSPDSRRKRPSTAKRETFEAPLLNGETYTTKSVLENGILGVLAQGSANSDQLRNVGGPSFTARISELNQKLAHRGLKIVSNGARGTDSFKYDLIKLEIIPSPVAGISENPTTDPAPVDLGSETIEDGVPVFPTSERPNLNAILEESKNLTVLTDFETSSIAYILTRPDIKNELASLGISLAHEWIDEAHDASIGISMPELTLKQMDELRENLIKKLQIIISEGTYGEVLANSGTRAENLLTYCATEFDGKLSDAFGIILKQLEADKRRPRGKDGVRATTIAGSVYHVGIGTDTYVPPVAAVDRWNKTPVGQSFTTPDSTSESSVVIPIFTEVTSVTTTEPIASSEPFIPSDEELDLSGDFNAPEQVHIEDLVEGSIIIGSYLNDPTTEAETPETSDDLGMIGAEQLISDVERALAVSTTDLPREEVEQIETAEVTLPTFTETATPAKTFEEQLRESFPRLLRRNTNFITDMQSILDSIFENLPEFQSELELRVGAGKLNQVDQGLGNEVFIDRFLSRKIIKPQSKDGKRHSFSVPEIAILAYIKQHDPKSNYDAKAIKELVKLAQDMFTEKSKQFNSKKSTGGGK